ncbi:hypothetical protein O181_036052 [Austropuccinia psidii MF-1]|uniref:Large ribosomal subunit protein mL46 N-terminal domain-containing protein n=1 Tax=Austropuccinia psidii MF-1 TaxID=1389203 RepID=A0A9Q3D9W6_9BASI|nr:hypothetical protein [Austropuccinia psidii MF-1]
MPPWTQSVAAESGNLKLLRIPSSSPSEIFRIDITDDTQMASIRSFHHQSFLRGFTSSASLKSLQAQPTTSHHQSTEIAKASRDRTRRNLAVASLLSRQPLLLPSLTEFESAYYQYQRQLTQSFSKPIRSSFFFRTGSNAAKTFELALKSNSFGVSLEPLANSSSSVEETDQHNFQDLERQPCRSIYLLIKCNHEHANEQWQLPTSEIKFQESLNQASLRAIYQNLGIHMDIWSIGKVPATIYIPSSSSTTRFQKVWVMPKKILRGKPIIKTSEKTDDNQTIVDFGWFNLEEIKDRVNSDLWKALEPVLKPSCMNISPSGFSENLRKGFNESSELCR